MTAMNPCHAGLDPASSDGLRIRPQLQASSGAPSKLAPPTQRVTPQRAAIGNAGSLSMSRGSCWMITVAFRFFSICFMRCIEAMVSARS